VLRNANAGLAEVENRSEVGENIKAEQTIDGALREQLVAGDRDSTEDRLEELQARNDHDRNELFTADRERFAKQSHPGWM